MVGQPRPIVLHLGSVGMSAIKFVSRIDQSLYRRERQELVGHPSVLVSYVFNGFLDEVDATFVLNLQHVKPFQSDVLWRYAAGFKTLTTKQLGVKLNRRAEGTGELEVDFDPTIPIEETMVVNPSGAGVP